MKKYVIRALLGLIFGISIIDIYAQIKSYELTQDEISTMNAALKADPNLSEFLKIYGEPMDLYKQYKLIVNNNL